MQRGNIAAQQYGTAGRSLDQVLNTDWSKIGSKFGFGGGGGDSTPGYGVYDGAVQGGPYGSA
jgi:hypothetical protein